MYLSDDNEDSYGIPRPIRRTSNALQHWMASERELDYLIWMAEQLPIFEDDEEDSC